jgi:hypothetical protein
LKCRDRQYTRLEHLNYRHGTRCKYSGLARGVVGGVKKYCTKLMAPKEELCKYVSKQTLDRC